MRVRLVKLESGRLDHELIWGSVGLVVGLGAWFYPAYLVPAGCPFKALAGFPCPTCGTTRAFARLREFDVLGALAMNPLIAGLALFAAVFCAYAWTAVLGRTRRIRIGVTHRREPMAIRIAVIILFFANWFYLIAVGR